MEADEAALLPTLQAGREVRVGGRTRDQHHQGRQHHQPQPGRQAPRQGRQQQRRGQAQRQPRQRARGQPGQRMLGPEVQGRRQVWNIKLNKKLQISQ